MAKLSTEDVKHVSLLAKLTLSPKEVDKFQSQLSSVLDFIVKFDEVNTVSIKPTHQVTQLANVTRFDAATDSLSQKEVLSNASSTESGFFKVPTILNYR